MKGVFALMLTATLLLGASAAAEKRKVEPLLLPMPLYNQHDYAEPVFTWHERDVTVEESGCGAACVAMVVGYFAPDDAPEPDDVMSLAGKLGLYRGDGLGRDALRLLLDEYGSRAGAAVREYAARAPESLRRAGATEAGKRYPAHAFELELTRLAARFLDGGAGLFCQRELREQVRRWIRQEYLPRDFHLCAPEADEPALYREYLYST